MVWEPYHKDGPGRPPRSPFGIFKALIVKFISLFTMRLASPEPVVMIMKDRKGRIKILITGSYCSLNSEELVDPESCRARSEGSTLFTRQKKK